VADGGEVKALPGHGDNRNAVVVSLCDYSGNWPQPWNDIGGHTVLLYDLKHGDDLTRIRPADISYDIRRVIGEWGWSMAAVLAAPLCTAFTKAAALHWARQDADGTTEACVNLVGACLDVIDYLHPQVWALENPRGRIQKLVPRVGAKAFEFDPCDYAGYVPQPEVEPTQESDVHTLLACNRYTKMTAIWGNCRKPPALPLDPIVFTTADGKKRGSAVWWKLGGKSARTKELRSTTPMGFARAFYSVNGCG
jgi:hypothetical protein